MHSLASSMEGNSWVDNGGVPNSFTSIGATNNYGPFDLYLMGFLAPALTPNTFYISAPSADTVTGALYNASSTPRAGANITGVYVHVRAGQRAAAEFEHSLAEGVILAGVQVVREGAVLANQALCDRLSVVGAEDVEGVFFADAFVPACHQQAGVVDVVVEVVVGEE